ncbi:uncharacterized protein DUF1801 [Kordia periserrulae]|uniref:Uncharacterized protein DUF1801 n=1 Tax=Kordia periserrulae TaxID=701523 RepID=A0A2T6C741_9FLAO|nr:DUF1801 domain-containing protein [Kordia periserrulae]PTX64149.1 uncharacterized protein DUF1801 [Kordia periserrulae]
MAKKTLVNSQTDKDVYAFVEAISNEKRKADAKVLLEVFKEVTGKEPKIWGTSIIGYGKYSYQRKNGDEFEWFNTGFSPGKAHLSLYMMYDVKTEAELLENLGKYSIGKGCLYIKKLEDVNMDILKQLIEKSDRWER